jgi:hypothetical protein
MCQAPVQALPKCSISSPQGVAGLVGTLSGFMGKLLLRNSFSQDIAVYSMGQLHFKHGQWDNMDQEDMVVSGGRSFFEKKACEKLKT